MFSLYDVELQERRFAASSASAQLEGDRARWQAQLEGDSVKFILLRSLGI